MQVFLSAISDNIFPEALNLCHATLYTTGKKQSNIYTYEASKNISGLQNELGDIQT